MERVSLIEGDVPVILVAPHGADEENTSQIVATVAKYIGAFAVINQGWKKSKNVDYLKDLANCNNNEHLHEDVVREEFLEPLLRFVKRIKNNIDDRVYIFNIHGFDNNARKKVKDPGLDLIVGYGAGDPSVYSCKVKIKDAFIYYLENEGFGVYEGKAGGRYAGNSHLNLNQLFKQWYVHNNVHSFQLEIIEEHRTVFFSETCHCLSSAIENLLDVDDTVKLKIQTKRI